VTAPDVSVDPLPGGVPADLGAPVLPGSKSHAQRALLLAAAGETERVRLAGACGTADVAVLARALAALGAGVAQEDQDLVAGGGLQSGARPVVSFDENGTALRLLLVAVPMLAGGLTADGAPGLRARPLHAVLELLAQGGAQVRGSALPLSVDGQGARWPSELTVDGALTSQPASGAMLGLALRCRRLGAGPATLCVRRPAAVGYLEMTAAVLDAFGYAAELRAAGDDLIARIGERDGRAPSRWQVPPDASAQVFPLTLAALHGQPLPASASGTHPDAAAADALRALAQAAPGAPIALGGIAAHPDSFPALAVAAAARAGETTLGPAPSLRRKESDRIAAMAAGLAAAGVACRELGHGLVVRGPLPRGGERIALPATADHRVVMALALLGTLRPIALPYRDAVGKSWPGFWEWLSRVADVRAL
jgi:3-phosphoshikimate 1-carboxyvinyltransferase